MRATGANIKEVFALMLSGEIAPVYEEIPFEENGADLERLKNNEVTGRLVSGFGD